MKIRTIQKTIQSVFDAWVKSIEDQRVRKLVQNNTLLAGGSIASMLLQEPVNDYDFYFRTTETAEAICDYYITKIGTKIKIKGTENRVHLFTPSSGIKKISPDKTAKFQVSHITENAITLTDQVQVILRFIGTPEQILENYDFMHVTNYWTSWDKKIVTNKKALECLLARELVYQGSLYPLASILRIRKFIKRGWTITAGNILKMVVQLSELDLTDTKILKEQLTGVDISYFQELVDTLSERASEGETIDATYIITLIENLLDLE